MDKSFGDWYRQAHLSPEDSWLRLRWQGVAAASQEPRRDTLADLARLFHGRKARAEFEAEFRAGFHGADSAFQMSGNDLELSLLAGTTLLQIMAGGNPQAGVAAAFVMACPSLQGQAGQKLFRDMVARARKYLERRSSEIRRNGSIPVKLKPMALDDESLKPLVEACSGNQHAAIGSHLSAILQSLAQNLEELRSAMTRIESFQAMYREESDALWWLTGRTSRGLATPFKNIDKSAACIIAGIELADMVRVFPGPLAASAILHELLCPDSEDGTGVALSEAVACTDLGWREQLVSSLASPAHLDLCPVLFALNESTRSEQASAWHSVLKKELGISHKVQLPVVGLAIQVYEECLLQRSLKGIEE